VMTYEPNKLDFVVPGIKAASDLGAALRETDLLVLLVAHTPFKELTPSDVTDLTSTRLVFDTVNIWPLEVWEPAGFTIHRLGVG